MKRFFLYVAFGVLAIRLVWMYVIPGWSQISTDFPAYYTPAWAVRHNEPLTDVYDPYWFDVERERSGIHGALAIFNVYPPLSALLMWPIANLSPPAAKEIWSVANILALAGSVILIARTCEVPVANVGVIALLGGDALGNNFTFGQFYIVLTLLFVVGVCFSDRIPILSGFCTALAALVKIFPAFLLLYFGVTRRWRALAWTLAVAVALSLIAVATIGTVVHREFILEALPRAMQGEILDPYIVKQNALQTLIRRAFVTEPSLNPNPIFAAPALGFFLRAFTALSVASITLIALRHSRRTRSRIEPLLQLGAITSACLLITSGQGTHQQFLLFPGIAAAVHHFKDLWVRYMVAGAFALVCSNAMGVSSRWDSGWRMLLAFPRAYIVLALWIGFLFSPGILQLNPRVVAVAIGIVAVIAGLSAARDLERWDLDERDSAVMVQASSARLLQSFPAVNTSGLAFAVLDQDAPQHPSGFRDGLVYELHGAIAGRLADGTRIVWSGASEPALGPDGVVAVRHSGTDWSLVERTREDTDWRELLRRPVAIHDPAPSSDHLRIAFSEWVNGHYRVNEWNRNSKSIRILVAGNGDYRYPFYSSSNGWLFFSENLSGNWNIVRLSLINGRREILTSSESNNMMPVVSEDERTLYFASDRRRGFRYTAVFKIPLP